jgi:dTDP-4-amino-4,6-dideoxygalactose transaminase
MSRDLSPFDAPIYVTKPLLPDLDLFKSRLEDVWKLHRLTNNGPQHKLLESRIGSHLKVPFVSLFNNGTIALIVACQSLRLSGDVITTPFTFAATPHVLTWNNIKPIFCDIDPDTMNIDAEKIESLITPQTTAILAVHVFGTPCNVLKIQEIADRYGLRVIYDAAHAFGVEIDGHGIGTYGDISMFSFHATKLFHTAEGGALTFNDANLKQRIDLLKNFGIKNENEVMMPGINGKMNELQAALGLTLIDLIQAEGQRRDDVLRMYEMRLSNIAGLTMMPPRMSGVEPSYQYLVVRINEDLFGRSRDQVYDDLRSYNVFARKYFYPLCSNYPCYQYLPSSNPQHLQIANKVASEVLSLPFYGDLGENDVDKICRILLGKTAYS